MKNKINWNLIANITAIISMTAVLIGFIVMANKIKEYEERILRLEIQYRLFEQDFNQLYEIDPGIKKID